jgi:hypothetical protein
MGSNGQEGDRDLSRANTKTREQRRADAEKEWRKNPVKQFASLKRDYRLDEDVDQIITEIREFEQYLLNEVAPNSDLDIIGVRDAVRRDITSFRDEELKPSDNLRDSTIANILSDLSHFYDTLNDYNAFVGNPVDRPLKEFRDNHDIEPDRPHIPFSRMQTFLNWLTFPLSRAFWLAGLKHGTRISEVINVDLRCLHIDHPIFWEVIDNHGVQLDPRIRDLPDTMLIYAKFNEGDEIPNEDTPGPEIEGEVRDQAYGNKRFEEGGSILPIDSEFKTALIEWLATRPPTYEHRINPLFVFDGSTKVRRPGIDAVSHRLWRKDHYGDSIQHFAAEAEIDKCPTCGGNVVEENPSSGDKTGRRFRCQNCRQTYWRSIYWDHELDTEQKVTYHVARHYFTNLHKPGKSKLHDGAIPDVIRKKRIRGDSEQDTDTEDKTYADKSYERYDTDIREPYLNGIAKFGIYDNVIPAVGEGWKE